MRIQRIAAITCPALVAIACGSTPPPTHGRGVAPPRTVDAGTAVAVASDSACRVILPVAEKQDETTDTSRRDKPEDEKDTCGVADSNLASAENAILARANPSAPVATRAWDHRTPAKLMDVVQRRYPLSRAEREMLDRQGFVVSRAHTFGSYASAYHEIFQSQLPVYVSADSIFHAVYAVNDKLIQSVELARLMPVTKGVLDALACALPSAAASYPVEVAGDVDVYITVARSLLEGKPVPSVLGSSDDAIKAILEKIGKAEGLSAIALFGRGHNIDWSLYKPRGHYAADGDDAPIARYFRAATWLSRLDLNLVSRSCISSTPAADKSETPREATVAIALSDLAERASAMESIDLLDRAWSLLAGKREDVGLSEIARLRKNLPNRARITIPDSAAELRAAIGNGYRRTARLHYLPVGCEGELAAISTMLGPRVVPDSQATRQVVNDAVSGRYMLSIHDMTYALGHDRAKAYLKNDLATYPELGKQLDAARGIVQGRFSTDDLYGAWLDAIRSIGKRPEGQLPSFMDTEAFQDLHINSAVAAFGQIRHNYVLIAGQTYEVGGCEIPDGYVEPAPAVYDALLHYAERGGAVMRELDKDDATHARAYFGRLTKVLTVLRTIAADELSGKPLTEDERRFLSMPAEMTPASTGGGPTYTGWYFDLFRDRVDEGLATASFIADYYTSGYTGKIAYAGARAPRLGFFVVETGGAPRAFVGPVASAFEHVGPLDKRLSDADAASLPVVSEPWASSYAPPAAAAPPLALRGVVPVEYDDAKRLTPAPTYAVKSTRALGRVTIDLLDHHRVAFASATQTVGAALTRFRFAPRRIPQGQTMPTIEGLRVRIGDASYEELFDGPRTPGQEAVHLGGMPDLPYDVK